MAAADHDTLIAMLDRLKLTEHDGATRTTSECMALGTR